MNYSQSSAVITTFSYSQCLREITPSTPLEKHVHAAILEQQDPLSYSRDLIHHGCVSGITNHLIYTLDIHKFFETYYDDIEDIRHEYEFLNLSPLKIEYDLKTFFAWFAFEEVVRKFYYSVEAELME